MRVLRQLDDECYAISLLTGRIGELKEQCALKAMRSRAERMR